jgi:hypothetical protein
MKEYKIIKIKLTKEGTEEKLNELTIEGWRIKCSYAYGNEHLILERNKRDKEEGKVNEI